jgi:hypothetical protein
VARDLSRSFRRFCPIGSFEIIRNNVWLNIFKSKDHKMYMEKKSGVFAHNAEIQWIPVNGVTDKLGQPFVWGKSWRT